jgi:predicted O-linked N-acetylglucosamine transferase (SPINDLY family)
MNPAKLQSLLQSALAHHRAGRLTEAENIYRQARVAAPRHFDVLHLSGLAAYQQGRMPAAIELLTRAHQIDRKSFVCEMRLALALLASNRAADGENHLRRIVEQNPAFHEGWDNLAYCLKTQDKLTEAVACHEKAVMLKPDHAIAWYNYGTTLSLLGKYADALRCHERALAADVNCAIARYGRAQALHQADRISEAVADYRTFLRLEPRSSEARSYLLFALHCLDGVTREDLFAEHLAFDRALGVLAATSLPNSPEPQRVLRVAILSPDLRQHSCAYFLEPILQNLNREQFECYLYHDHFREDAVSAKLRSLAVVWRNFVGQPAPMVEQTIRGDAPDILIDLAGHTGMTNRLPLFARRLAPVQITYLGYPNTTGLKAMDYRFTDVLADPVGEADAFATEKLVRFAPTAWTYQPSKDAPDCVARTVDSADPVTFGCFNTLAKITDEMLSVWARLLESVGGSRLLLKGASLGNAEVRKRYLERFQRLSISAERVELVERTPDTASHLALYNRVDVALDTFPYHGTTTTCEALWMGVPVVSLAGDRHMSRVGVSLLTAAGHPELVATTSDEYVRIASQLANDPVKRAVLRRDLRDDLRRGPLLDHVSQAAHFAAALRECWVTWCDRQMTSG